MYIGDRDRCLHWIFVIVGSSLLVWVLGIEPKIMIRSYYPWSL